MMKRAAKIKVKIVRKMQMAKGSSDTQEASLSDAEQNGDKELEDMNTNEDDDSSKEKEEGGLHDE